MPRSDRDERLRASKEWYEQNKERHKARVAERTRAYRRDMLAVIRDAKDVPCIDCGGSFHPVCMEFDHVRGEKAGTISMALRNCWSVERLRREIAKCEIVCSNCHQLRTFLRREAVKHDDGRPSLATPA